MSNWTFREVADNLEEWAYREETVDNRLTKHGKDCIRAAWALRELALASNPPDHSTDHTDE